MASKALVVGAYQKKLEEIAARPEVDHLTVVVPPGWQEPGGRLIELERSYLKGYDLRVEPIRFNGNFHAFHWPTLGRVIREVRPDVVHVDEEPYNLATALATWQARRAGAKPLFFTWQNLLRRYPPPFSLFEQYVFRASRHALIGNAEADAVLRAKGYRGPTTLIPQFGFDPSLFAAKAYSETPGPVVIGYIARLVPEKGPLLLLDALQGLQGDWRLHVIGTGPLEADMRATAESLGLSDRVTWELSVPSTQVAERLRSFDLLVLPSLTQPNWKEQFGRVLVESMACEVPVVASTCGEMPNVVGDCGVIFPEGDPRALREALQSLVSDAGLRRELGRLGRERVMARYTHARIAEQTVSVYRQVVGGRQP